MDVGVVGEGGITLTGEDGLEGPYRCGVPGQGIGSEDQLGLLVLADGLRGGRVDLDQVAVAAAAVTAVGQVGGDGLLSRRAGRIRMVGGAVGVSRSIAAEALLVAMIGIIIGGAVTVGTLLAVRTALDPVVANVPIAIPWPLLLTITATCGLLTLLASIAPTVAIRRNSHAT